MAGPSLRRFRAMKEAGEKIVALTAYDVLFARILEEQGVDLILVGDTLGEVVLGYQTTLPVTLEDMLHHGKAVRRGAPDTFTVVDLPFLSYQVEEDAAIRSAGRVLKEEAGHAVKLEGADPATCARISRMVEVGIPVMGHVGLTPQSIHSLGGYRVQGRDDESARRVLEGAQALEEAGCFSVVLELVAAPLAAEVTRSLDIPTIGIGSGVDCDGQVLVLPDALGLNAGFQPRFLKRFADLHGEAVRGVAAYVREVREGRYPDGEHSFSGSSSAPSSEPSRESSPAPSAEPSPGSSPESAPTDADSP